mmetsp:Transcript_23418/g.65775  ORF Transcript_23418/g.65775 Transcript_23418/m.65775 type:complete len:304 (+) Transcript_23418:134-1045(+)
MELEIELSSGFIGRAKAGEGERVDIDTATGAVTVWKSGCPLESAHFVVVSYHDIGLTHTGCFATFFGHPGVRDLFQHAAILHVDCPGHESGAADVAGGVPSLDALAEQIYAIIVHLNVKRIVGLGSGLGANVLTRFGLKYSASVSCLVLASLRCGKAGWGEWLAEKFITYTLRSGGYNERVENFLLAMHMPYNEERMTQEYDRLRVITTDFAALNPKNLAALMERWGQRDDIHSQLHQLRPAVLLLIGRESMVYDEMITTSTYFSPERVDILEVADSHNLVFDEAPGALVQPIRLLFAGLRIV